MVLAHLHNESWVTIRACKFGRWPQGLYATYVFFGGKPNVYAPREVQFFGSQPILQGMRLDTRLRVHQHLVKQRFLPKDIHTPERQDAIVKALVNRAQFSAPFAVASMPVADPIPEDAARYEGLIDALNAETTHNDVLKAKFSEQGLALTALARVSVVAQNAQWLIKDEIKHEGTSFQIAYQIYEEMASSNPGNRQTATLWAEAKLIDTYSAHEYFPIQLFFNDTEHNSWRGKLVTLASYVEPMGGGPPVDPQHKTQFEAVKALLDSKQWTGSGVDIIKARFADEAISLSDDPPPKITLQSSTGSDPLQITVWVMLDGQEHYLVKLEHPVASDGVKTEQAHTLTVYSHLDQVTRLRREYELMSYLGTDPDTPGTELAAYLDRFSIEDLVSLIDYLRTPFKPGHSVHIHQALQALHRKKDFSAWVQAHHPIRPDTVLLQGPTYYGLSRSEEEDKHTLVYQYDFKNIWREIKAQTPSTTVGQEDLFFREEEDLATKLKIVANRNAPPDQVPDSPYTDLEELRALEKRGVERFFSTDKTPFEAPEADQQKDCEEFKFAIAKWQEVQHQEPETIKRLLGTQKTPGGKSVLDIILKLGEHHNFLKDMAKLVEIAKLPTFPTRDEVIKGVAKRGFLRLGLQTLAHLIELDFIFTIPFTMWMEVLEIQQKALETWRIAGKLTAITHWLWALDHLTYTRKDDFPDDPEIDIATPHHLYPDRPYFLSRYYSAVLTQRGTVAALHDTLTLQVLRAGFDEAASKMDQVEVEILRNADDALSDVLRQANLDSCKIKVLTDAGILEIKKLKALVVRALAQAMLDNIPKVPR